MIKIASLALATLIGGASLLPSVAAAIDNGPCDHCTMEPIVVKGDRPKKTTTKTPAQQLKANQPSTAVIKTKK